jgi:hypothetical protein
MIVWQNADECCLPRHQVAWNMFFSQITLLDLIGVVRVASKARESLKLRLEPTGLQRFAKRMGT